MNKEVLMDTNDMRSISVRAILAMADIKAAVGSFDRGQVNVFDALASIAETCSALERPNGSLRDAA
jgi:hypothetical protein